LVGPRYVHLHLCSRLRKPSLCFTDPSVQWRRQVHYGRHD
jgi:hypothetical protein